MFTGLVEAIGVLRRRDGGPVARAVVASDLGPLVLGESIDVNGACLTVDRIGAHGFEADMSDETLARTTLGELPSGARVHLERATPAGGRLGGHIVLGHVDGVGRVVGRDERGSAVRLSIAAPAELERFVAEKGSIAVDGVSLTVNGVGVASGSVFTFDVMLVPHTLGKTLLGLARPGSRVNLEADVLARYVARQLAVTSKHVTSAEKSLESGHDDADGGQERDAALLDKLRQHGFA